MVCDTPSSQDVFTHQSWNSYLKEYRRYAPDSMQFLETRSEVKIKVTVTQLWYVTLCHPKMHPHTKFEIPTSNHISYRIMVCDTSSSQDASTHQIWDSYLKSYKRYAMDTIILKTRSEVKVTVTQKWYMTLRHPKMYPYTKYGIPNSKNIKDMLGTQLFFKLGQRSRSQWPKIGMWHPVIPRYIFTPNLEFLSQRI